MKALEKQELHNLLQWPESITAQYVRVLLSNKNYTVTESPGDYIFGVPTGPPLPVCLVVHMDTMRTRNDEPVRLHNTLEFVYNGKGILGADDRAGVAIVLQLLRRLPQQPYVLFTHGEERGCTGARQACEDRIFDPYLRNINAFISYDRRGFNECVTYSNRVPDELVSLFTLYGYESKTGSTSDVRVLSDKTGIAHVNLSAGYIDQHTSSELLFYKGVDFAVSTGLQVLPKITTLYVLDPPAVNTAYYGPSGTYKQELCSLCGQMKYSADWQPAIGKRICLTCLSDIRGIAPKGATDKVAYTLFLANKKATCPKCGQLAVYCTEDSGEYLCNCGTSFTIENGQKVWYTYVQGGGGLGSWVQNKSCVYPPAPKTIPPTCSSCNSKRKVFNIKDTGQWLCATCLIKHRKAGDLTRAQVSEAIRARNLIPF